MLRNLYKDIQIQNWQAILFKDFSMDLNYNIQALGYLYNLSLGALLGRWL